MLCRISRQTQPLTVTHSLTTNDDMTWSLFVNQHQVEADTCPALGSLVGCLDADKLSRLRITIEKLVLDNLIITLYAWFWPKGARFYRLMAKS